MITREEAQQVLDALQCATPPTFSAKIVEDWQSAVEFLRARLSAPEPEPVAWRKLWEGDTEWTYYCFNRYKGSEPLYTTPPQREWQGLTRGDADSLRVSYTKDGVVQVDALLMRVDEILRERNT